LGIYLFVNKERGGGSPKFFIRTLGCHNYMRLKFNNDEFNTLSRYAVCYAECR
jgi:hypothetical protein